MTWWLWFVLGFTSAVVLLALEMALTGKRVAAQPEKPTLAAVGPTST